MRKIVFRDLPMVADIERQLNGPGLFKDELEELERAITAISLEYFGITIEQTYYSQIPVELRSFTYEEWERHFEFIEYRFEEEQAFWDAVSIDVNGENGEQLECFELFGRQMVCAIKQLHPDAYLSFRNDGIKSDAQIEREAQAWGKSLRARKG